MGADNALQAELCSLQARWSALSILRPPCYHRPIPRGRAILTIAVQKEVGVNRWDLLAPAEFFLISRSCNPWVLPSLLALGRDESQLFRCKLPINRALGCGHRSLFDWFMARYRHARNRCRPFPHVRPRPCTTLYSM